MPTIANGKISFEVKFVQNMIWLFPYHILYQPSTNIIPRAKALGMILVSRVDTGCDTERAIYYSLFIFTDINVYIKVIQYFLWFKLEPNNALFLKYKYV